MNKRARLNYINALSQNVEHKKMYKAKKQWVVAGISFLVATGMGAVSHLTTHADTTQAKTQTTLPINKGSQSKQIGNAASNFHNKLISNAVSPANQKLQASSGNQVPSAKASATPASSKVSGNQSSSNVNAKSSVSSNVATSGNGMNTLNLGDSSEQTKGWNYVQSGIKNLSKNSNTSLFSVEKKHSPLIKAAAISQVPLVSDELDHGSASQVSAGHWGTATWNYYKNGQLDIHDGSMGTPATPKGFNPNNVKIIKTYNAIAPVNSVALFAGSNGPIMPTGAHMPDEASNDFNNVENIDLSGLDTSQVQDMTSMFHGDGSLTNIKFGDFQTQNVRSMAYMFDDCTQIKSLDLNTFQTNNCHEYIEMFWDMPNLQVLDLSNFNFQPTDKVQGMFRLNFTTGSSKLQELILSPNSHLRTSANGYIGDGGYIKSTGSDNFGSNNAGLTNSDINKITLYDNKNGNTIDQWSQIAKQPRTYVDNNNKVNYSIHLVKIDPFTNVQSSDGYRYTYGLPNVSWIPVSGINLPSHTKIAPNQGESAPVNNGQATVYVIDTNDIESGTWGHANYAFDKQDNVLAIRDGAMDNPALPSGLSNYADKVQKVITIDAVAPADSSNLFTPFEKATDFDLRGLNFKGTYNIKNVVPNDDASVEVNGTYYDKLENQQSDDASEASASASSAASSASSYASSFANSQSASAFASANSASNAAKDALNAYSGSNQTLISELADALANAKYSAGSFTSDESSLLESAKNLRTSLNSASNMAMSNANLFAANLNSALNGDFVNNSYQHTNSLTSDENTLITTAANDYKKWSNAANWVSTNSSEAGKAGSWYASNSSAINTIVNSMSNADTAYTDAISAFGSLSSIVSNSNSVSSLSNEIHEASGIQDQINSISNEIGSTSNSSTLASDYSALSTDVTQLGSAISGANNNGGINSEIAKLQSQTAFTFRLHNENTGANEPFTVAKSYITQHYNPITGTKNQYDITDLLSAYVQSKGQSVKGHYIVTLTDDNTASLSESNQNVGMSRLAMPRHALSAIHLLGDSNKASDDTVVVYDNPVTYQGTIKLNFNNGKQTINSHQLNFNTTGSNLVASDSVNLLNYLSDRNLKGISDPSTLLSKKLISGFDTTGFTFTNATASDSYNNNGKSKTVSMPKSDTTGIHAYNFTIQPSDAINQNNNSNTHNYDIVLNYSANPVTETINYVYGKHSEGSVQTPSAAADDTPSYWTTSSGVKAGWQLSSASNSFTYTKDGSVNVNVVPEQASAYIEYEDVNHNNSKVVETSVAGNSYSAVNTGASGNNSFTTASISTSASYYGVPSGYKLSVNSASNYYYGNSNSASPIIIKVAGNSMSPTNPIKPSPKPSDASNPKSNQNMKQPSGDNGLLVTINAVDYDSNDKSHTNTKYVTESGRVGDTFTISAKDYQTYGYQIDKAKDKDSDVTLKMGANGLTEKDGTPLEPITFNYYAIPYDSKTTHNYDPNNPIYPQPITIDYDGEVNGKANQLVLPDSNVITGATGDTGNITNYKGINYENISDMANMAKQFSVLKGYTYGNNSSLNPNFTITTKPQTITINLASKTASDINRNKKTSYNKKVIPSDKPTTPSSDNTPSKNKKTISDASSDGYVTVIIAEHDANNVTKYSYQTVDLNNAKTGYGTLIDPTSYTPTGYQVDSNDTPQNAYTDANGDADPKSIQFDYDINQSEIEPIDIVYKNQFSDFVDRTNGKSVRTGESVPSDKYTQKFTQSDLAKLGTVGDSVNIAQSMKAPLGHHFNLQNGDIYAKDANGNSVDLNNIQLQKMPAGVGGVLKLALTLPEAPKPNSNTNKPSSSASTVSMSSDQLASLASKIGSNITIRPNISETDEVVDNSALTSLASEVATNNQEISNLANKPTSAASTSINYDYFNNLVNNGVSKLTNAINRDFKSNIKHVHAQPVKPRRTVGKRTYSYLKWLRVVKPLKLYNNSHEAVKVIKPRHRITLNVKAAYEVNNHIVFKVSYKHHNYFIKANNKDIKNAYLPASHKLVGRKVRVLYNVYANRRKASGRVKTLHKGYKSTIKHIVRIGNHNVTRIQLADGLWISANMNYVEVL